MARTRSGKKVESVRLDPEDVLTVAIGYHRGIKALTHYQVNVGDHLPAWSQATLQSFVIELLFKALIAIEGKWVPKTHEYLLLMDALEVSTQKRIAGAFDRFCAHNHALAAMRQARQAAPAWPGRMPFPETVHDLLTSMNDSFRQFRYIFEKKEVPPGFLGPLAMAMLEVIQLYQPELLRRCEAKRKPSLGNNPPLPSSEFTHAFAVAGQVRAQFLWVLRSRRYRSQVTSVKVDSPGTSPREKHDDGE